MRNTVASPQGTLESRRHPQRLRGYHTAGCRPEKWFAAVSINNKQEDVGEPEQNLQKQRKYGIPYTNAPATQHLPIGSRCKLNPVSRAPRRQAKRAREAAAPGAEASKEEGQTGKSIQQ